MKRLGTLILSAFALAASLAALPVSVDGKWTGQTTVTGKGVERTIDMTLELKNDGGTVTGKMTMGKGKRMRPVEISDGKLDGDKLTFSTKMSGRNGERKANWEGTVKDGAIELKRGGGRRAQTLTLKRAS